LIEQDAQNTGAGAAQQFYGLLDGGFPRLARTHHQYYTIHPCGNNDGVSYREAGCGVENDNISTLSQCL
jgi:hypothetical protein